MTVSPLPVLWLCGAPGTGKSTVAWQVLLDLEREGVRAGYVDIDQLGMVYLPPDGDPDRERLKAANLEAVIPEYAAAGARVLVVSGVVQPEQVRYFTGVMGVTDGFEVTFCQVTVEESVLRRRLTDRGWSTAEGDEAVEEMRMLRRAGPFAASLDTTAGTPAELAAECRRIIDPAPAHAPHPLVHSSGPGGEITVVCGPRAVGKSAVSWAMFRQRTAAGQRTCYLDLDQISILRGGSVTDSARRALRTANLAVLWRTAAARGATALIANGMVTDDDDITGLRAAVHPACVHVIRLSAESAAIRDRIQRRYAGFAARLAGDDLEGASPAYQERVFNDALDQERRLSTTRQAKRVIDTTTMSVDTARDAAAEAVRVDGAGDTVRQGTIVVLNGTSSSGKTTLARELLAGFETPWFHLAVDAFGAMRSVAQTAALDENGVAAVLRRTRAGFHRSVAAMAVAGNDVVADYVFSEPWRLLDCLEVFAGYRVVFVGLHCSAAELERRERARGDRTAGQAVAQLAQVHAHGRYDLEFDTETTSPEECARRIRAFLAFPAGPTAFDQLRAEFMSESTRTTDGP